MSQLAYLEKLYLDLYYNGSRILYLTESLYQFSGQFYREK